MAISFVQLLGFAVLTSLFLLFECEQIPNQEEQHHAHGRTLRGEFDIISLVNAKTDSVIEDDNNINRISIGDNLRINTGSNRILLDSHNTGSIPKHKISAAKTVKLKAVLAETASLETLTYWAKSGVQLPLIAELKEFWLGAINSPFKLRLRDPDKYPDDKSYNPYMQINSFNS